MREMPGFSHIWHFSTDIPFGLSCRSHSWFLSDTDVHIPTCTPKDDKLAVSFTCHVTSKAKRREIMILG